MDGLRIESIKRRQELTLTVDGQKVKAYRGETVLAALIAAGFRTLRIHPVSHEPRGALCGMGICFECTLTIDGVPNSRACMTEVRDGMTVETHDQG